MLFHIQGLQLKVHIGLTDDESSDPQEILLDAEIDFPLDKNLNDNLDNTLDYRFLSEIITKTVEKKSWVLLETLNISLIDSILESFPKALFVEITLSKTMTKSYRFADSISVTINSDEL